MTVRYASRAALLFMDVPAAHFDRPMRPVAPDSGDESEADEGEYEGGSHSTGKRDRKKPISLPPPDPVINRSKRQKMIAPKLEPGT